MPQIVITLVSDWYTHLFDEADHSPIRECDFDLTVVGSPGAHRFTLELKGWQLDCRLERLRRLGSISAEVPSTEIEGWGPAAIKQAIQQI